MQPLGLAINVHHTMSCNEPSTSPAPSLLRMDRGSKRAAPSACTPAQRCAFASAAPSSPSPQRGFPRLSPSRLPLPSAPPLPLPRAALAASLLASRSTFVRRRGVDSAPGPLQRRPTVAPATGSPAGAALSRPAHGRPLDGPPPQAARMTPEPQSGVHGEVNCCILSLTLQSPIIYGMVVCLQCLLLHL